MKSWAGASPWTLCTCYPNQVDGINISTGLALAGLIIIFCESARMQPIYNAFAVRWKEGKALNRQLMDDYVWKYVEMSRNLQAWKSRNYTEPHRIREKQATSLVLNTGRLPDDDCTNGDRRPRVELLAIRADLGVIGTKIVVFDGKRGQIIYRHCIILPYLMFNINPFTSKQVSINQCVHGCREEW